MAEVTGRKDREQQDLLDEPRDKTGEACDLSSDLNLEAKTSLPRHGYLLPRARLRRLLTSFTSGVVALVAGPGYGKTAFLADALLLSSEGRGIPRAYIAFGEEDRDPREFFRLLFHALERAHPGLTECARERLADSQDLMNEAEQVMGVLLRDLGRLGKVPLSLGLDDIHLVQGVEPVRRSLELFLEGAPPNWLIFACSRRRLPFTLEAARLDGRLCEVSSRRLRLTPHEVVCWAEQRWQVKLDLPEARAVWRTTQGWPVALVLMGELFQQGRGLPVKEDVMRLLQKGVHLNQYLATHVFDCLEPLDREIIQAAAPLPRVVFPRDIDYLPGQSGEAESLLTDLVDRGFLANQVGHRAFNLHPLVRGYAERRLTLAEPAAARELNVRAAKHLEQAGEWVPAITLYLRSEEPSSAARLFRELTCSHLNPAANSVSPHWMTFLRTGIADKEPWLRSMQAALSARAGDFRQAIAASECLLAHLKKTTDRLGELKTILDLSFYHYCLSDIHGSIRYAEEASKLARETTEMSEILLVSGNLNLELCNWDVAAERIHTAIATASPDARPSVTTRANCVRAKLFFYRGIYDLAFKWAEQAAVHSSNDGKFTTLGARNLVCLVHLFLGNYEKAEEMGRRNLRVARDWSLSRLEGDILLNLGDALVAQHRTKEGIQLLREAEALNRDQDHLVNQAWILDSFGDISRRTGRARKAIQYRQKALELLQSTRPLTLHTVRVQTNLGMDFAVAGKEEEAERLLRDAVSQARKLNLGGSSVPGMLYMGWLCASRGEEGLASRYLTEAIEFAEEHRHVHFLLQEAACATPILALCARHGSARFLETHIIPRLSTRLQAYYRELSTGSTYPTDAKLGPPRQSRSQLGKRTYEDVERIRDLQKKLARLTMRETEILALLSKGMPNKAIGHALFITEKTIKTHTNRIFRKLEVSNRMQAALLFQEHQRSSCP